MRRRYRTPLVEIKIEPGMTGTGPLLSEGVAEWYSEGEAEGFMTIVADTTDAQHADMLTLDGVQYLGLKGDPQPA